MADISKCWGNDCPVKERCYRYTAPANLLRQSYGGFIYDKEKQECKYFWDNTERK